jgi:hypothetical protein
MSSLYINIFTSNALLLYMITKQIMAEQITKNAPPGENTAAWKYK